MLLTQQDLAFSAQYLKIEPSDNFQLFHTIIITMIIKKIVFAIKQMSTMTTTDATSKPSRPLQCTVYFLDDSFETFDLEVRRVFLRKESVVLRWGFFSGWGVFKGWGSFWGVKIVFCSGVVNDLYF